MRLKLKWGIELFFQKIWSKLSLILFLCLLRCSFTSETQRKFVTLQFAHPMTQKSLNLIKQWVKYWKMFRDNYMFDDGRFYLSPYPLYKFGTISTCCDFGWGKEVEWHLYCNTNFVEGKVPPHTQIMLPALYNHTRITCGHLSIFRTVLFVFILFYFFKSGNFFTWKHIFFQVFLQTKFTK